MYYIIYKITNSLNDKFYIGQHRTNNLEDGYMGSGLYIKNAKNKYKEEFIKIFKKEILEYCDNFDDMQIKEEYYIKNEYDNPLCTNIRYGGSQSIHSEKTKEKLSESHKGKKLSNEHKNKIRQANLGKVLSQETKDKISNSKKLNMTDDIRKKISKASKNRKVSQETKDKISKANKGRILGSPSENTRKKISDATKGKLVSQATKEKISIARKGLKRLDSTKLKISEKLKNKSIEIHKCPHCGKEGKGPIMFRFHFHNCKKK
jgi:hypothetical protein